MFRLLRKPAAGFAARAASTTAGRIAAPAPRVQAIRLQHRKWTFRRVAFGAAVYYVCYRIYANVVLSPIVAAAEKELDSLSDKERAELEKAAGGVDDGLFIPFPFTTRQVEPVPYRGSDPEWQAFVKISRDKDLQKKIRLDMVNLVKAAAEKHPVLAARTGSATMKVRRWWLDIDFPYKPPPTFEQSGIRFDDDGIFWATEPVDSVTVNRLRKLLWPTSMAQTTFVFGRSLFQQHLNDLQAALGLRPSGGTNATPSSDAQRVQQQRVLPPPASRQTPDGTTAERAAASEDKTSTGGSPVAGGGGATRFPKGAPKDESRDGVYVPESIQRWIKHPFKQSSKTFAETWTPTLGHPPRGCIMLSGLVEIETPKALFVVDVASWWNPTTKNFDRDSMVLNLRRFEVRQQRPLR